MICGICWDFVAEDDHYEQVTGWSRTKGSGASHGGSQIVLRKPTGVVAHIICVKEEKLGIVKGQGGLGV